MARRLFLALVLVLLADAVLIHGQTVPALPHATFAAIDRHALTAPPDVELTVERLAAYLVRPARDDREKMRALFRWMADRIAYDVQAFFQGQHGELRPEAVLRRRRAVC